MKKLSPKLVENLAQSHTAGQWKGWNQAIHLTPEPKLLHIAVCSDMVPALVGGWLMLHRRVKPSR